MFHLAALRSVPRSLTDPVGTREVNATGTLRALGAARAAGRLCLFVLRLRRHAAPQARRAGPVPAISLYSKQVGRRSVLPSLQWGARALHVKGTVQAAEADAFCETVNIGTGRRTSVLDLLRAIELLVGHPVTRRRLEPRAGDVRDFEADIARARRVLGYEPAVSLEEGLRRRVEFFRVRTSGATP